MVLQSALFRIPTEIWQFCYAKAKNVETAKAAPEGAGDTWTWTALDADSKLIVSWLLGERDGQAAYDFMMDLAERLTGRVQLTSDGLRLYEWKWQAEKGPPWPREKGPPSFCQFVSP